MLKHKFTHHSSRRFYTPNTIPKNDRSRSRHHIFASFTCWCDRDVCVYIGFICLLLSIAKGWGGGHKEEKEQEKDIVKTSRRHRRSNINYIYREGKAFMITFVMKWLAHMYSLWNCYNIFVFHISRVNGICHNILEILYDINTIIKIQHTHTHQHTVF